MATKSSKNIEADIFEMLSDSSLGSVIGGQFYRDGMRPADSKAEDAVVKFLTGIDGQAQDGVVLLHLYVTDIDLYGKGAMVENIGRVEALEDAINNALESIESNEYVLTKDGTPQSYRSEDYNGQHFINARIKYKRITINK